MISLLKGILDLLPATAPNSPASRPVFLYSDFAKTLGAPEDPKATNSTGDWSIISLFKGFLEKVQAL